MTVFACLSLNCEQDRLDDVRPPKLVLLEWPSILANVMAADVLLAHCWSIMLGVRMLSVHFWLFQ